MTTEAVAGGYDAVAALAAVVEAAVAMRPDLLILTGDLANDGLAEEYRLVRRAIAGFPALILAVPGNHDRRDAFAAGMAGAGIVAAGGRRAIVHEAERVRLIGLDTLVEGADSGMIGEAQLAQVAETLARDDPRPVLVFLHHPPFEIGLPLDWTRCSDGAALGRLLLGHPRVLGVTCGHVHRQARVAWAGATGGVCPSVAWEIPLELAANGVPCLVPQSPAFQLHVVDPVLGLVSHTQYVTGGLSPLGYHA